MNASKVVSFLGWLILAKVAWAQTVPVKIAPVQFENHSKSVIASGIVRPISEQTLSFKVPGISSGVFVQEGQTVKKGQLLASLELEEIDAQVAKAKAMLSDAKRKLARLTELESQALASNEQMRQTTTQVNVAEAELRIALFNRKHAQIHAPANGRILTRHIEKNEVVASGQPIFEFADEGEGWAVNLSVADVDVVMLNIADQAQVSLDAYPGQTLQAQVKEISGRAHPSTQTFEVVLALKDTQKLYSGLIAHCQITPNIQTHVAKIPMSALMQASGLDAKVYVLNQKGEAELRQIKLAYFDGEFAYVKEGLKHQEDLVIEGGAFIRDGKDIAIVNL